jgi:hypothetical protein
MSTAGVRKSRLLMGEEQEPGSGAEPPAQPERIRDPFWPTANKIARKLGETNKAPQLQIRRIVEVLGPEQALAVLAEVKQVEANGGMLVPDGSRRRTPGGVFFVLARRHLAPAQQAAVFPAVNWKALQLARKERRATHQPGDRALASSTVSPLVASPFTWADRVSVVRELGAERGEAKVKVTLVGRPGKIITKVDCVITSMESMKVPDLPKGVPVPPSTPTTYTLYIARKQFEKIEQTLQDNGEDKLIVEGYAAYDPELEGVGVYATNVTTVATQAAKRQSQQQ